MVWLSCVDIHHEVSDFILFLENEKHNVRNEYVKSASEKYSYTLHLVVEVGFFVQNVVNQKQCYTKSKDQENMDNWNKSANLDLSANNWAAWFNGLLRKFLNVPYR